MGEVRNKLDSSVAALTGEVGDFKKENEKLVETRQALGMEVTTLSNKMKVLDGEMKNMEKTRDMLDAQVQKKKKKKKVIFCLTALPLPPV